MARYRHLPTWKAALDLAEHLEQALRRLPRAHKDTPGRELCQTAQRLCRLVARANDARAEARAPGAGRSGALASRHVYRFDLSCLIHWSDAMIHQPRHLLFVVLVLLTLAGVRPALADLTPNPDGTVTDDVTGLIWDRCSWGQTLSTDPDSDTCDGTAIDHALQGALGVAVTANTLAYKDHTDWRLPNRKELESLVDIGRSYPAIDTGAFPNTPSGGYALYSSSTPYTPIPTDYWLVNFANGETFASGYGTRGVHVRLVRGGQSFNSFDAFPPCGLGLPYTTGQWQQFAVPCVPSASPASIASVLGTGSAANLPTTSYSSRWILYGRNAANSGNVTLASSATIAPAAGYWFKSLTAPADGTLMLVGTTTPVETGDPDCQSANGCVVIAVPSVSAGSRMLGNPFPYNVEWSKVRVRVNGAIYTPSAAESNSVLDNQIWIWNGASYDTWDDVADPGNLQYFKSFFIKVLASGVGQTIELLIPAEPSTVPVTALPSDVTERLAGAPRSWLEGLRDWLIPAAAAEPAAEPAPGWQVRLRVTNPATGAKTRALLGQRPEAQPDYDPADLSALAPFASPYLTLVFPQPGWGVNKGDYASDFRPADGAPDQWNLELHSNPVGSRVVLRWEGDPATLARSRLTDRLTGQLIDPGDPAYADGYPLTLTTKVRALSWEYFGD